MAEGLESALVPHTAVVGTVDLIVLAIAKFASDG